MVQVGRHFCCLLLVLAGACGPMGCGASADGEAGSGVNRVDSSATADIVSIGRQQSDALYGAEPLVPAIRLAGFEPSGAKGADVPPVFQVSTGGILAPDFTADERAAFHPHGSQVCASGCAASNHATPELTRAEFDRLLNEYQAGPLDETNRALETLLFYGRQSAALLDSSTKNLSENLNSGWPGLDRREAPVARSPGLRTDSSPGHPIVEPGFRIGTEELDSSHAEFLGQELEKTHALLSFRVVDEQGIVRVEMRRTRVPLDRRHVFGMETTDLPPLVTSGTVKRVGLHHLWTRL